MNTKAFWGYYLSDLVYGANDGIITTFAVVAAASGAGFSSQVIVVLGIANLIADGFSMGASRYLSLKSEQEYEGAKGESGKRSPLNDGWATFLAFVVAGSLPLVPFVFGVAPENQFLVSTVATAITFFGVGSARALLTKLSPLSSGFEMLVVGGLASTIAYALGRVVAGLV
jgi:VIT1/CCC1 family predicted Fe2+/Mn2+ transporter